MKYLIIVSAAVFILGAEADLQAQTKSGLKKTKQQTQSSLSPGTESNPSNPKETNVSQSRENPLEKENGYYQMSGERDWGTNAQMNGYPYPVVDPSLHPEESIDTAGHQIQSGLYDGKGNASGDGAPVQNIIDQKERSRKKPFIGNQQKKNKPRNAR